MSKLLRLPLVLLVALAMTLLWALPATAELPPTAEECATPTPPQACSAIDAVDGVDPTGAMSVPSKDAGTDLGRGVDDGSGDALQPGISDAVPAFRGAAADPLEDCADPTDLPDCILDCEASLFAELPVCDPPPPPCEELTDLPGCTPDCAFVAHLLGQAGCPPPPCLDLSKLPPLPEGSPDLSKVPGLPACPPPRPPAAGDSTANAPASLAPAVSYENCDDARAKGKAPVYSTDPGYRAGLDSDSDGIGCEDDGPAVTTPVATGTTSGTLAYTGVELEPLLRIAAILISSGTLLLLGGLRRV